MVFQCIFISLYLGDNYLVGDLGNGQRQAAKNLENFIELDQAYHLALARATGNKVLFSIVDRINDILAESRAKYSHSLVRIKQSIKGHENIFEAILQKDPNLADQAMSHHLIEMEKVVLKKIS